MDNYYWEANGFLKTERFQCPSDLPELSHQKNDTLCCPAAANRLTYFVMTAYANCSSSSPVLKEQSQASQRNPPSKQISLFTTSCQNRSPISLAYVMMPSNHDSAQILYWKCLHLQAFISSQKALIHTAISAILASCHTNCKSINERNHLLMSFFSFTLCLAHYIVP